MFLSYYYSFFNPVFSQKLSTSMAEKKHQIKRMTQCGFKFLDFFMLAKEEIFPSKSAKFFNHSARSSCNKKN